MATRDMGSLTSLADKICRWLALMSMWLLVIVTALIGADIIGRYFGHRIPGAFEIGEEALCFCLFLAMPYAWVVGGHVRANLVIERFRPRIKWGFDTFASVLCGCFFVLITLKSFMRTLYVFHIGEVTMDVSLPIWITYAGITFGSCLFAIRAFISSGIGLYKIVKGPR